MSTDNVLVTDDEQETLSNIDKSLAFLCAASVDPDVCDEGLSLQLRIIQQALHGVVEKNRLRGSRENSRLASAN